MTATGFLSMTIKIRCGTEKNLLDDHKSCNRLKNHIFCGNGGSMNVLPCLLNSSNSYQISGRTLGEIILTSGKEYLWSDRTGVPVDTVVIHYISASALNPQDPFCMSSILAIFPEYGVSSHYLIDRNGIVFNLVPEEKKAWHCGGSIMPAPDSRTGVNDFSIGIELAATADSGFTESQYLACAGLCDDISTRQIIHNITGHQNIAGAGAVACGLRQGVKEDPGPLFNWEKFRSLLQYTTYC
jgi:N-acetylmuramoyl-L-alanine amidase